jgi:hypothetical protein
MGSDSREGGLAVLERNAIPLPFTAPPPASLPALEAPSDGVAGDAHTVTEGCCYATPSKTGPVGRRNAAPFRFLGDLWFSVGSALA